MATQASQELINISALANLQLLHSKTFLFEADLILSLCCSNTHLEMTSIVVVSGGKVHH